MDFIAKRDFSKLIAQSWAMFQIIKDLKKEDFFGTSPPSVFVGSAFYPNLNVGILSPPAETEDAWIHDAPNFWSEQDFTIKQIALLRSALINSRFNVNIKDVRKEGKFLDKAKEMEARTNELKEYRFGFERKLTISGRSLSLGIPSELASQLNLKKGQKVKIYPVSNEGILIKKA